MTRRSAAGRLAMAISVVTTGCAMAGPTTPVIEREWFVEGRVLATRDIVVFVGDVATEATGFHIETTGASRHRVIALDRGAGRCTGAADGRTYRFALVHRRDAYPTGIGIRDAEDRKWVTDLDIASCAPLPAPR